MIRKFNLRNQIQKSILILLGAILLIILGCKLSSSAEFAALQHLDSKSGISSAPLAPSPPENAVSPTPSRTTSTENIPVNESRPTTMTKFSLWVDGPHLRGANFYQRRVYPELDNPDNMGSGPVGPPFTQADLDRLAAMGANYVNISGPGLFTEKTPFVLDQDIQKNLDNLLDMAAKADLFAVISFRTGPGRSEFTFMRGQADWFASSYYNDTVWSDPEAQKAWLEMWRYTAQRYRDNPVVVGYDLMVEPNCSQVCFNVGSPKLFYTIVSNGLRDWRALARRITQSIRQVDDQTPILVGSESYSQVSWLPYNTPTGDPRTVYTAHQYAPHRYTHQLSNARGLTYPGRFDLDSDLLPETFDHTWLTDLLSTLGNFMTVHQVPVAVNEFGVMRWAPGAESFIDDQMAFFESHAINSAIWSWTYFRCEEAGYDAFNFQHGSAPQNNQDVQTSPLIEVIRKYWALNKYRPSNTKLK
jgi:hypothetical protein